MKTWIRQSDTHFDYVAIFEEPRLDGFPKITCLALGEVKYDTKKREWDIALLDGRVTSFAKLENAMKAVAYLAELSTK